MTLLHVFPGPALGHVGAPSSKSYTHRALVAGFFSDRPTEVVRPLDSDDTRATLRGLEAIGARVERGPDRWTVQRRDTGRQAPATVRCGRSGTTLRFLLAVAATLPRVTRFVGDAELAARPVEPLVEALEQRGATAVRAPRGRSIPIAIRGPISAGSVAVDASSSSQYLSALLLVLPSLPGDSVVRVRGRVASAPYVDATRAVLSHQHVGVRRTGHTYRVRGAQIGRGGRIPVPGDASSAAYLWGAAAVSGGEVTVGGDFTRAWPQADLAILDILRDGGARLRYGRRGVTVAGRFHGDMSAGFDDAPDLLPLAGAIAAVTPGTHRLRGGRHAILKESDRRAATADLARRLGAGVSADGDLIRIRGARRPRALRMARWTDHRLVMSATVAALAAVGESVIGDAQAVRKSYPGFWDALTTLGVRWEAPR